MSMTPPAYDQSQQWPAYPHGWPQQAQPPRSKFGVGMLLGGILGLFVGAVATFILVPMVMSLGAPGALGDDPRVDGIYGMCEDGEMAACDLLYYESAPGSVLEEFAATCGGRDANPGNAYCTELNPGGEARPPEIRS